MPKSNITLQINIAPFDYRHVIDLIPHYIELFYESVNEILLVLDYNKKRNTDFSIWNDFRLQMVDYLEKISDKYSKIRISEVDYSNITKAKISSLYFNKNSIPNYDFRGAPFYQYFYGLYVCSNDLVFHLDSDMFLCGNASKWLDEALDILSEDNIFSVSPLPGPPHPDKILKNQKYIHVDTSQYKYSFNSFSTRIFLINRKIIYNSLKLLSPSYIRCIWALTKGFPIIQTVEETITKMMNKKNMKRIDFLGSDGGIWSLHPLFRSEEFYNNIPLILDKMKNMDFSEEQLGYYNFIPEFMDWGKVNKAYK